MLIQFSVENFRSFKERAVLSMEASSRKEHEDHVAHIGKERILRTASIFGANAAGKSNLFRALAAAILILRQSNMRQVGEPLTLIQPFAFDEELSHQPSSFEFVFLASGLKYVYGFSTDRERILKEYLYVYRSARPSTIFERDRNTSPEFKFTNPEVRKELAPIVSKNASNKLFLATATAWNAEVTRAAYLWFSRINTYSNNYNDLIGIDIPMLEADSDNTLKQFICQVLHQADINISDYEYKSGEAAAAELSPALLSFLPNSISNAQLRKYSIMMTHQVHRKGEIKRSYELNFNDESQGTKSLFMLSPILFQAFRKGMIICVDEFDTSLHPLLVGFLVGLFHNPEVNQSNAQLIISSHTTTLLSRKLSRMDELYLVDKNYDSGESSLYSLDEFSLRKDSNVWKGYLLGRFGGVPDIAGGELLW